MIEENDAALPGMVAKYEAKGSSYDDMQSEAYSAFASLFRDRDWAFLAAQIEPGEQEVSFDGTARVVVWAGTFYAITTPEGETDE